ncbi:MAG: arginine--tRNA ligase, partial [Planctomycetaceae bacterium]
ANADPKDKQAGKSLKKLRSEIAELREEIKSLEKKREAVETSPALRELAQVHPNIVAESRQEIAKLHAGDEQNQRLWTEFMPACRAALDRVYDRLGVTFEETLGESFYQPMLADVVADLKQKNLAVESAGAVCVFIEGNEAPFIVQKSDGAFTYATTDLATIRYRAEEFGADAILYVVDARQSEHFQLLFAAARKWGHDGIEYRHVSFGTVLGPDGKPYRTRAGDTVGLESLLDEAVARAARVVAEVDEKKKDGPELGERERAAIAEIVGMGAVKYADLHHNRESDYKFDWDKMLALTGDTAAYVQYSVARIHGIFRKGAIDRESLPESGAAIRFTEPEERALALQLLRFPEALDAAIAEYRPNLLTQYLFETANVFTAFYEKCSVLNADDEATRDSRLLLCDLYGRVLTQGLELLGIGAPQRM